MAEDIFKEYSRVRRNYSARYKTALRKIGIDTSGSVDLPTVKQLKMQGYTQDEIRSLINTIESTNFVASKETTTDVILNAIFDVIQSTDNWSAPYVAQWFDDIIKSYGRDTVARACQLNASEIFDASLTAIYASSQRALSEALAELGRLISLAIGFVYTQQDIMNWSGESYPDEEFY